jgi:predicted anti-sigma-YlaC factor YlaD
MKQNNHQVVSAYLDAKPILLERKAISAHLQKHPELRNALPEVTTVAEAVSLVSMDRPLSRSEQAKLTQLLKADLG